MRRVLAGLIIAGCLGGCGSTPDQPSLPAIPASCSGKVASLAANKVITPILNMIADPKTRDDGCSRLDGVLKDSAVFSHYEEFKPDGCDWDYGNTSPYEKVKAMLTPRQGELSKLCDWERKDAERSFQQRGEQVLQGMSAEDRQTLERAYKGE